MKAANRKTRIQVVVINGHNVLAEAMWEKSKTTGEWIYMGLKTIEVFD